MDPDFPHLAQRSLRLGNGVSTALLHDPQATRVALAVSVAAGSCHEPPAWPGLAHFLEHSLFLGSVGCPEVGAFADYVHGHGGRYNARTLGLQTLYYLEMPARELRAALLRLIDLLARPLFADTRLQAEREVLHAEYLGRCQDGDCQLRGAIAGQLHPLHPLARFHAGARETLDPGDPQFIAELRAWHRRHYCGANLRLLVSGPQSLDELEHAVRELAGVLPAGARAATESWPSLWPVGQAAVELTLEQPQTLQTMSLWLPLRVGPAREDELLALLRQAVAQPAGGGLLAELRARGWARQLSVECHPGGAGEALLALRIELLESGGEERAVAALCCDWLRALAGDPGLALPPDEWPALQREQAWQELELAPMERAGLWVERWQRQGGLEWQPWSCEPSAPAQRLRELALLSPQRLILQVARERLDAGESTPWFPVRASAAPLAELPAVAAPRWQRPPANPFVEGTAVASPLAWPEGWADEDAALALRPGQAALALAWQMPGAGAAPARMVAELAEAVLASQWQQALSGAARLGHDWQPLSRPGQLRFCLSGPAGVLPQVLEALLASVRDGDPARWRTALQRQQHADAQQLLLRRLLAHPAAQWRLPDATAEDHESGFERLADAELQALMQAYFATAQLYGRRFGAPPAAAWRAVEGLGTPWSGTPPSAASPWRGGEHEQRLALGGNQQAVLLRLLAPPARPELEAAWRLLAILQQGAFYQALRVEQGLGYALFSRFHAGEDGAELQFGVQSPHADAQCLQQAIRQFIAQQEAGLATLAPERLEQARQAALEALAGGSRRARLLAACSDWLGGRPPGQYAAVREALQRLDAPSLQSAAAALPGSAEWRWLLSQAAHC